MIPPNTHEQRAWWTAPKIAAFTAWHSRIAKIIITSRMTRSCLSWRILAEQRDLNSYNVGIEGNDSDELIIAAFLEYSWDGGGNLGEVDGLPTVRPPSWCPL